MDGVLLSKRDHERLKRMLRDYETNGKRPQYRRRAVSVGGGNSVKLAMTQEAAQTDGTLSVKLVDSSLVEIGDAFDVYVFPDKATTDYTGYTPTITDDMLVQVSRFPDGDWRLVWPTLAQAAGGACFIAEVDSDAAGGGYYNCHIQTLDATDWNTDTADQIDDTGDSVVVANMAEIGADVHALDAGDMLLCWQFTDDEGTSRYIGMSPRYFWWHA